MKKINVAKSVDNPKKKTQPEKKIFYSLLLCVFAVVIVTSFFSGKVEKVIKQSAKNTQTAEIKKSPISSEIPNVSANTQKVEKEEKKAEEKSVEIEAPKTGPEVSNAPAKEVNSIISPVNGEIAKPFSDKNPVYSKTMNDWRVHNGIDISASIGDSVFACAEGVVEDAYVDKKMGATVIINHGNIKSKYQNLASKDTVKIGQEVRQGDTIGVVGDTASYEVADPPHLHFEVLEGDIEINPEKLFSK